MVDVAQVLTIAGSDSGGGAGIQADLKTFQMRGVYGMSVVTAVTAQNTLGVSAVHSVPPDMIEAQLAAVFQDFAPAAVKIGMLGTAQAAACVAEFLAAHPVPYLVVDPVMVAKGGADLLTREATAVLQERLLPLADVVTPNLPEAEVLSGQRIATESDIAAAADAIMKTGARAVIIKGGHSEHSRSAVCRDHVFDGAGYFVMDSPRFDTAHTHGTGCTFSACLTAELAKGRTFEQACRTAKAFITAAVSHPLGIGHGHGPTNHWAYAE